MKKSLEEEKANFNNWRKKQSKYYLKWRIEKDKRISEERRKDGKHGLKSLS